MSEKGMRSKEEIKNKIMELEAISGCFDIDEYVEEYIEGAIWALKWVLGEAKEIKEEGVEEMRFKRPKKDAKYLLENIIEIHPVETHPITRDERE